MVKTRHMDQKWFEMTDIRRRKFDAAVWIPLRCAQTVRSAGRRAHSGHTEEFFGVGSVAMPVGQKENASSLSWQNVGLLHSHKGYFDKGRYVPADVFESRGVEGLALVLVQDGNSEEEPEWHLHQDLVIALGLKRESDTWLAVDEDYVEVARLRKDSGRPVLLEIRAEHLKDYLCARAMALFVSSYMSREETVGDASHITWPEDFVQQVSDGERWEGRKAEIHEGGHPFGSSTAVFHIGREDIDYSEDVPHVGPFDSNFSSKSWTVQHSGKKLVRIWGELWRDEWVEPGKSSPRVRRDKLPSPAHFITDSAGTRASGDRLEASGGWLWFRPNVVMSLLQHRGGGLQWYTRDTGGVRCSPSTSYCHFGVNKLGLVNVYAKDIGLSPHWIQMIWAGFNVGPEGGVSAELLAAQAEGSPADTQAPEDFLPRVFERLAQQGKEKFGIRLFRPHDYFQTVLGSVHRFRATDAAGLFALAKDLARLTADSIDAAAVRTAAKIAEELGSLKSLEALLALHAPPAYAHAIIGPLFAIYELRLADAHLPSSDDEAAFMLLRVDRAAPCVIQGYQLLHTCVSSLYAISQVLEKLPDVEDGAAR